MKALVYHGPDHKAWEDFPAPVIVADTDATISVELTTICGTDLNILKGDPPSATGGRVLGHEAVGTVETVGQAVDPQPFVSHRYAMDDALTAYDIFTAAADTAALKVITYNTRVNHPAPTFGAVR
jgi:threonine dehydrogenase-like Zn-dependent dehydrogenase